MIFLEKNNRGVGTSGCDSSRKPGGNERRDILLRRNWRAPQNINGDWNPGTNLRTNEFEKQESQKKYTHDLEWNSTARNKPKGALHSRTRRHPNNNISSTTLPFVSMTFRNCKRKHYLLRKSLNASWFLGEDMKDSPKRWCLRQKL